MNDQQNMNYCDVKHVINNYTSDVLYPPLANLHINVGILYFKYILLFSTVINSHFSPL
jgi:hypothetical protein